MVDLERRALIVGAAATVAALRLGASALAAPACGGPRSRPIRSPSASPAAIRPRTGSCCGPAWHPTRSTAAGCHPTRWPVDVGGGVDDRASRPSRPPGRSTPSPTSPTPSTSRSTASIPDAPLLVPVLGRGLGQPGRPRPHPRRRVARRPCASGSCRARTTPAATTRPWRRSPTEECDLWLHLGDYIYENAGGGPTRSHGPDECFTLDAVPRPLRALQDRPRPPGGPPRGAGRAGVGRPRGRQQLRRSWTTPGGRPATAPGSSTCRCGSTAPDGPDLQIYRRFRWGDLATFHMLDVRQYRDPPPCGGGLGRLPGAPRRGPHAARAPSSRRWLAGRAWRRPTRCGTWSASRSVFSPLPFGPALQQRSVGRLPAAARPGVGDAPAAAQPGRRHRRHPRGRGRRACTRRSATSRPPGSAPSWSARRCRRGSTRPSSTPPRPSSRPCPTSSTATPAIAATRSSTSPATGCARPTRW